MNDAAKITQEFQRRSHNFGVIDTTLPASSCPEMNREIFPAHGRLPVQRHGQPDVLQI
jgi:hypothetical protein